MRLEARYTFLAEELALGINLNSIRLLDGLFGPLFSRCLDAAEIRKEHHVRRKAYSRDGLCFICALCKNNRIEFRFCFCCISWTSFE